MTDPFLNLLDHSTLSGGGGLGLRKLCDVNTALLAKLGWRLITEPNSLWSKILLAKYGSPLEEGKKWHNASPVWRSIRHGVKLLKRGLVADGADGTWRWRHTSNGRFTVQSAYDLLQEAGGTQENRFWSRIWKMKGPQRLNFNLWQIRHGILPTHGLLHSRHGAEQENCSICGASRESNLHAVRDCYWIKEIWQDLVPRQWHTRFFDSDRTEEWIDFNLSQHLGEPWSEVEWNYVFREMVAIAWFWRNRLVHSTQREFPVSRVLKAEAFTRAKLIMQIFCKDEIRSSNHL